MKIALLIYFGISLLFNLIGVLHPRVPKDRVQINAMGAIAHTVWIVCILAFM